MISRPPSGILPPLAAMAIAGFLAGCGGESGPELGSVYGTVKMDGKPLQGASVIFQPEKGRPSTATTDSEGYYELQYTADQEGAVVGPHRVMIRTYQEGDPDAEDPAQREKKPETVPAEYNDNTTLTKEVKAGNNEFNFDLKSGGQVIQPEE